MQTLFCIIGTNLITCNFMQAILFYNLIGNTSVFFPSVCGFHLIVFLDIVGVIEFLLFLISKIPR